MSWSNIQYEFPQSQLFKKELLWVDKNINVYFAFKLNDTDEWNFWAGNTSHALDTGKLLTNYGTSESSAQTNYLTTTRDSNGKVLAVLPANFQAKYARVYIQTGSNASLYEWHPSTFITAHEIIAGELLISDELTDAPLIRVTKSSIDRIKIGNFTGSTYGIVGYDGSSNKIFELSDAAQTIAGWSFSATSLSNGSLSFDSSIPAIKMGSATDYMTGTGAFLGLNGGAYKFHFGNPASKYIKWDGTDLTLTGVVISATSDIAGTASPTFTLNNDLDDTNIDLIFGRTTGGNATLRWNGVAVKLDKNFMIGSGTGTAGVLDVRDQVNDAGGVAQALVLSLTGLAHGMGAM